MNEELVDVAVGRIVQPDNRLFHGNPMPTNVYRIQLVRVLDGYDELVPPYRPPGADDEDVMNLRDCLSWNMLWPKCQIRLGRGTPPHGQHRQSCRRQAMARPLQCRQLIQATTPWTRMWPKIGATPTQYWTVSMSISTNMVGVKWKNFSGLLLKNPTLVQKTLTAQPVARR